jgi:hypothetical protein
MAELADALASGASIGDDVQVQVLFRAQKTAPRLFGGAFVFYLIRTALSQAESRRRRDEVLSEVHVFYGPNRILRLAQDSTLSVARRVLLSEGRYGDPHEIPPLCGGTCPDLS